MIGAQLFELFAAPGVTRAEIAPMTLHELTRQIHELREMWVNEPPDNVSDDMSDTEIAQAMLDYARADESEL